MESAGTTTPLFGVRAVGLAPQYTDSPEVPPGRSSCVLFLTSVDS